MKKLLLFMLVVATMTACKKEPETAGQVVDIGIMFSIENGQGIDLLDRETPGYIDTAKVTVYGVDNHNLKYPIYEPLMAAPRGFGVRDKKYAIEPYYTGKYVFGTSPRGANYPVQTMYIKWPNGTEDKLTAHIESFGNVIRIYKLEINGQTFNIPYDQSATFKKVIDGENVTFVQLLHP